MDYDYNLVGVATSNDRLMVNQQNIVSVLGKSKPNGAAQVNSVMAPLGAFRQLYVEGPIYLNGVIMTPLQLTGGISFPNGTAAAPSISFTNDMDTGFYLASAGQIGVSTNGVERVRVDSTQFQLNTPITTGSGDLVLNPAGANIDLSGKTLINAGGITVSVGSANQVIVNNSSGVLSGINQLLTTQGGTHVDSSASSGIAHVATGTWTFSPIVNADIDINAGISRGKIALFGANQVVINSGTGALSQEVYLATVRGGTGIDTSASSGIARVTAGTWSVSPLTNADFTGVTSITTTSLTTDTLLSPSTLTITPGNGIISTNSTEIHQTPAAIPGGDNVVYSRNVSTSGVTPATLLSITTATGSAYAVRALITLADSTGATDSGSWDFIFKAKNIGGVLTVSSMIQLGQILDPALAAVSITATNSGTNLVISVTGVGSLTIHWVGRFEVVSQTF